MNKITPTMIDDELVDKICEHIGYHTGCVQIVYQVLAWLANNPIPATWSDIQRIEQAELSEEDRQMGNSLTLVRAATAWQRIAYLKQEEPLPEELKKLQEAPFDKGSFTEMWNERLVQAYKIGLSRK